MLIDLIDLITTLSISETCTVHLSRMKWSSPFSPQSDFTSLYSLFFWDLRFEKRSCKTVSMFTETCEGAEPIPSIIG